MEKLEVSGSAVKSQNGVSEAQPSSPFCDFVFKQRLEPLVCPDSGAELVPPPSISHRYLQPIPVCFQKLYNPPVSQTNTNITLDVVAYSV